MGRKYVQFLLFLTFISLHVERSVTLVTCKWKDSVPSGGQCFLFNSTQLSYSAAQGECHAKGGVLAKVTKLSQIIATSAIPQKDANMWIGASDAAVEGTWLWDDGGDVATELSVFWTDGEPKTKMGYEDCAQIEVIYGDTGLYYNYGTIAKDCNDPYGFLCMEKEETTTSELTTTPELTTTLELTTTPELTTSAESVASTSISECPQKNGAKFTNFKVLLFLPLSAFRSLVIRCSYL
ncbi:unnamed protein product [Lymnaea stagnalis]|uniref:C-type lectin domain-containing protein n=1 Tax=Lymnaea stagnalis TaxID=6523 RepID=A0AAV2HE52_LYMST